MRTNIGRTGSHRARNRQISLKDAGVFGSRSEEDKRGNVAMKGKFTTSGPNPLLNAAPWERRCSRNEGLGKETPTLQQRRGKNNENEHE